MHKLCEFIDNELEELEEKVKREGSLSRAEIEDGKNLAKFKMAILTNEAMEQDGESGYYPYMGGYRSYEDGMRGRSGARRRDAMGRYSREGRYSHDDSREDMVANLREIMQDTHDEHMKKKLRQFIAEIEQA